ncbi:putative high-affinity glucose protein [Eutypa lata UCREL1]|uniref:Putative high-affinity glucose protein n=1 Tax=Eutypa lata (strain UCR-EL1) TaxID=1287681 RepID=M7TM20_EUTLA|nr:putative high-affinity glucose protein [Eutypa lata UCREL1]
MAMGLFDILGRRSLVFHGGYSQAAFLVTIGALGRIPNPNANQSAYITAAEIGTQDLREKTMALATGINVIVGFVVVVVTPYLLAEIGAGLGYIWGGFAFVVSIWAWCFMPELKGRNLEEIDPLFEANLPAWKFNKHQTEGQGTIVAHIERCDLDKKDIDVEQAENIEMGLRKPDNDSSRR